MEFAKYVLLAATNILAFAGAWLFSFTETDKENGKKSLTRWGKIALPVASILLIGGFGFTIWDDHRKSVSAQKASEEASQKEAALTTRIDELNRETRTVLDIFTVYLLEPSPERDKRLARLIAEPEVRSLAQIDPQFASSLRSLEQSLGGREAMIARMRDAGAALPEDPADILAVASVDLQMFGFQRNGQPAAQINEAREAVLSLLRGIDADIVSIQEVADIALFQTVLNELPQYFAVYGQGDARIVQVVLVRADRIKMTRTPVYLNPTDNGGRVIFGRTPIVLRLTSGQMAFNMIAFHLRSQVGGLPASEKRLQQIKALSSWIRQQPNDLPVILAGRTQVGLDSDEMSPLLDLGIMFGTRELPEGSSTLVSDRWGPIVMTHIGARGAMAERLIPRSTIILSLEALLPALSVDEIQDRITDNNPVVSAFRLD